MSSEETPAILDPVDEPGSPGAPDMSVQEAWEALRALDMQELQPVQQEATDDSLLLQKLLDGASSQHTLSEDEMQRLLQQFLTRLLHRLEDGHPDIDFRKMRLRDLVRFLRSHSEEAPPSAASGTYPAPFTRPAIDILSAQPVQAFIHAAWENEDRGRVAWTVLRDPDTGERTRPFYQHPSGLKVYADETIPDAFSLLLGLSDSQVNTGLISFGAWLAQNGGAGGQIVKTRLHVSQILDYRGIKKHHKGGYRREDKEAVSRDLRTLNNLWVEGPITVWERRGKSSIPKQVLLKSRFMEVAFEDDISLFSHGEPYAFRLAPGDWAEHFLQEPNRQIAMLLRPVMQYDPLRQNLAMRLGIYLPLQWRIRASHANWEQPWTVKALWEGARKTPDEKHPGRSRSDFEKALDRLQADGVIASWEYARWDEDALPKRGWLQEWLKWTVQITPPQCVLDQYASLAASRRAAISSTKAAATSTPRNRSRLSTSTE